jgi:hypothetical protein
MSKQKINLVAEKVDNEINYTLSIKKDSIIEGVIKDISDRSIKGQNEYATTMDRTDLTEIEWLTHLYEEQLDSCVYLKKIITDKLNK